MSDDNPKTILSLFSCGHALVIKPIRTQGGIKHDYILTHYFLPIRCYQHNTLYLERVGRLVLLKNFL